MTIMETQYKTQRAEDRALGRPLHKSMEEDPAKRGIPLFLQAQNRRPGDPKKLAALREAWRGVPDSDPNSGRKDWRKPRGMSWDEWDAYQQGEAARRRQESLERVAKLRVAKGLPPTPAKKKERTAAKPKAQAGPGYKGHKAGSRLEQFHRKFDEAGPEAAAALAVELELNPATVKIQLKRFAAAK